MKNYCLFLACGPFPSNLMSVLQATVLTDYTCYVHPWESVLTDLNHYELHINMPGVFPWKTQVPPEMPLYFESRFSYYNFLIQYAQRVFVFARGGDLAHRKNVMLINETCNDCLRQFRLKLF